MTKINASGTALVYSTYIGGSGYEWSQDIALDSAANVYVAGYTFSTNFPTWNPLQATMNGAYDGYIAALNTTGTAFRYSTYLGGTDADHIFGIAVDNLGSVYVAGETLSTNFGSSGVAVENECSLAPF